MHAWIYHVYNDKWEAAVGETLVCLRELRNAHDRYAVAKRRYRMLNALIIRGGKIFVGLIFVVEGTHENFNTTKISAYTIC